MQIRRCWATRDIRAHRYCNRNHTRIRELTLRHPRPSKVVYTTYLPRFSDLIDFLVVIITCFLPESFKFCQVFSLQLIHAFIHSSKGVLLVLMLSLLWLLPSALAAQPSAPDPISAPLRTLDFGQLNFLHTTDTHGWLAGHLQE